LFGNKFEASLVPLEDTIEIKYSQKDDITKEVVALLNVPQYNGAPIEGVASRAIIKLPARLRFTGGGWKITIDYLAPWAYQYAFASFNERNPEDVKKSELWRNRLAALIQFPHTGGTLLTHALRVERENGSTFGLGGAAKILKRLGTFLSFAFGRQTQLGLKRS
jgi:hypothetical protein